MVASGITDQEGKWTVTLERGSYIAQVDYDNRTVRRAYFDIPCSEDTLLILAIFEFIIKVVDENGNPVPKAFVVMYPGAIGYTSDAGIARAPVVPSRRFELTVRKEGWKTFRKTYEYGATQIGDVHDTIVLSPTRLTITVRDPQGNPVSGALVKLMRGNTVVREAITS